MVPYEAMTQTDASSDSDLLQDFVRTRSECAFRALVERHAPWLFAAALRQLRDPHLAEDAVQTGFILLAQKASTMRHDKLTGWLFNTLHFTVKAMRRNQLRRERREQEAAQHEQHATMDDDPKRELLDHLDATVQGLSDVDRDAILLRFYQQRSFGEVAAMMKITEETARQRVTRALARLRKAMRKNGSALTASSCAVGATHGLQQAPPMLVATITQASLHTTTLPATTAATIKSVATLMAASKFTGVIAIGALVAAVAGAGMLTIQRAHYSAPGAPVVRIAAPAASGNIPFAPNLKSVQTFYFHGRDGASDSDVYLTRSAGMVEKQSAPGWSTIRYMNDETEWCHREGSGLVLRKKVMASRKFVKVGELADAMEATLSLQNLRATREPSADSAVDGVMCQAYRLSEASGICDKDSLFSIQPATGRVVRMRLGNNDLAVSYDPPLPEELFKAPSGPGIQIVDAHDYFESKYPLEGARFRTEKAGMIFAVHEVTQDAGGCFHLICTSRMSPASKVAAKDAPDDALMSGFSIVSQVSGQKFHYRLLDVAGFQQSGFQVNYVIAIPQKDLTPENHCQFGVSLRASAQVEDPLLKEVLDQKTPPFAVDLEAKVEAKGQSAHDFAGRAYGAVSPYVGLVANSHAMGPAIGAGLAGPEACVATVDGMVARYAPEADGTP